MGIKVTKNGLEKFKAKLEVRTTEDFSDVVANAIADEGELIAKTKYMGTNVEVLGHSEAVNGETSIIARGNQIAYMEFGTGLIGDGTYPDKSKLPKEPITFESPKPRGGRKSNPENIHTTNGWEYYYDNPKTKVGDSGWYYQGKLTKGQPAQAQMFYTAKELRDKIPKIVKEKIGGKGGRVS